MEKRTSSDRFEETWARICQPAPREANTDAGVSRRPDSPLLNSASIVCRWRGLGSAVPASQRATDASDAFSAMANSWEDSLYACAYLGKSRATSPSWWLVRSSRIDRI